MAIIRVDSISDINIHETLVNQESLCLMMFIWEICCLMGLYIC